MQETEVKNKNKALGALLLPLLVFWRTREAAWARGGGGGAEGPDSTDAFRAHSGEEVF